MISMKKNTFYNIPEHQYILSIFFYFVFVSKSIYY